LSNKDNTAEQSAFKAEFKSNVRKAFWAILTSKYDFYKVVPHSGDIKNFVKENFMLLNGKIYTATDGSLILALERNCQFENEVIINVVELGAILEKINLHNVFYG
jgi:hypothetical protein